MPMLKVLLNSGVGDVIVVVTRYYGGVKLGKGGLARAYSGGVQHALREMKTSEHIDQVNVQVIVPYAAVDLAQRVLQSEGARVIAQAFSTNVALLVRMPVDREEEISRALADATNGAARIER
jgi:putative IMPACT (imprinted ancient) family translation regulator